MRHSFSLALLYALAAAFWIFGSDQLVLWLNLDPEASTRLQTTKGWAFVVATTLLLFFCSGGSKPKGNWKRCRGRLRARLGCRSRYCYCWCC